MNSKIKKMCPLGCFLLFVFTSLTAAHAGLDYEYCKKLPSSCNSGNSTSTPACNKRKQDVLVCEWVLKGYNVWVDAKASTSPSGLSECKEYKLSTWQGDAIVKKLPQEEVICLRKNDGIYLLRSHKLEVLKPISLIKGRFHGCIPSGGVQTPYYNRIATHRSSYVCVSTRGIVNISPATYGYTLPKDSLPKITLLDKRSFNECFQEAMSNPPPQLAHQAALKQIICIGKNGVVALLPQPFSPTNFNSWLPHKVSQVQTGDFTSCLPYHQYDRNISGGTHTALSVICYGESGITAHSCTNQQTPGQCGTPSNILLSKNPTESCTHIPSKNEKSTAAAIRQVSSDVLCTGKNKVQFEIKDPRNGSPPSIVELKRSSGMPLTDENCYTYRTKEARVQNGNNLKIIKTEEKICFDQKGLLWGIVQKEGVPPPAKWLLLGYKNGKCVQYQQLNSGSFLGVVKPTSVISQNLLVCNSESGLVVIGAGWNNQMNPNNMEPVTNSDPIVQKLE